jgi:hypothetical protein
VSQYNLTSLEHVVCFRVKRIHVFRSFQIYMKKLLPSFGIDPSIYTCVINNKKSPKRIIVEKQKHTAKFVSVQFELRIKMLECSGVRSIVLNP